MILEYCYYSSPVGLMLLATEHNELCWLSISAEKEQQKSQLLQTLQQHYSSTVLQHSPGTAKSYLQALEAYFQGKALPTDLVIRLNGTPWQRQVWRVLQDIPHGTTISYTELAQKCDKPQAARAVASACGQNHIALLVPCHRVVAKSGALSGYRWGIENKNWLLNWENA